MIEFYNFLGVILLVIALVYAKNIFSPLAAFALFVFHTFNSAPIFFGSNYKGLFVLSENALVDGYGYMCFFLVSFYLTIFLIHSVSSSNVEIRFHNHNTSATTGYLKINYLIVGLLSVLLIEVFRRLIAVDFSVPDFINYTLGPRFGRPWSQSGALGGAGFLGSLSSILFPAAPFFLGILIVISKKNTWLLFVLWLISSVLVFFDYSRTFFFLASVAPYLGYAFVKGFKGFGFYFIGIVIVVTMQLLFSVQLSIRDYGLFESLNLNLEILNFSYKQDDSFYWILSIVSIYNQRGYGLEGGDFFIVSMLNFIPRFFWSGKPALLDGFYEGFKPHFIAVTALGELVMFFGPYFAVLLFIFIFSVIYLITVKVYGLSKTRMGFALYFIWLFYVYSIFRSLLNISMGFYIFGFALIIYLAINKLSKKKKSYV